MSVERNLQPHVSSPWDELDRGLPTIRALAELCAGTWVQTPESQELNAEAGTLLFIGRERGVFELKTVSSAFQSADRLLAVYVELSETEHLVLRGEDDPRLTLRYLAGFRQLCAQGLIMHQVHSEFSLTHAGFQRAEQVPQSDVAPQLRALEDSHSPP